MLGSCATATREPCQGLTAAALSEIRRVPQGSFSGVNRRENVSVRIIKGDLHGLYELLNFAFNGSYFLAFY